MHESAIAEGTSVGASEPEPLAYKVPEAARLLGMGKRKCWQLVHAGEIRSYKVGAARFVSRRALLDYIEQQENAA